DEFRFAKHRDFKHSQPGRYLEGFRRRDGPERRAKLWRFGGRRRGGFPFVLFYTDWDLRGILHRYSSAPGWGREPWGREQNFRFRQFREPRYSFPEYE